MKLVYLANLRLPTEKAYGIQIAKMCEAFANGGHEVKLLYPYRRNPNINQNMFYYYSVKNNFIAQEVRSKDFYFPGFFDKIAFLIKNHLSAKALIREGIKENANFYYTRDEEIAYILSKQNKNVIFECHRHSNKRKAFYPYFKKIVAISNGLKDDLVKSGIKETNILVAHDGVDLGEFNTNISKEESRLKCGLPLDKKIVMYTGHLFEWKGADGLAGAAAKIPNTLFIFVGGTEKDIKRFKEKHKLDNVLALGHKPHKDIPGYLRSADILVLPNLAKEKISRIYTSPLKLFEYMASGRPIVASRLPSIMEVLNDGNSILVNPDNLDELANGINKLFNDSALNDNIVKKALEDVKEYTWQKRAEKIMNFVNE